jgi:hypothetical protein
MNLLKNDQSGEILPLMLEEMKGRFPFAMVDSGAVSPVAW